MRSYGSIINKYLKQKKSYVAIVLSLILGISLLTTISIISNSNYINAVSEIKGKYGDYDIRIQSVDKEVLDKVNSNDKIGDYAIGQSDGVVNIQYGGGRYGIVDVYALEKKAYDEYFNFKIVDGRMPQKEDEVMINSSVVTTLNQYYKVGDTITLDVETNRTKDNYDWYEKYAISEKIQIGTPDNLVTGDKMDFELPKLTVEKRTYKVVGIVDCGDNNPLWSNRIFRVLSEEEIKNPRNFELFTRLNVSGGYQMYTDLAEDLGLNFRNAIGSTPLGIPTSDIKFSGYEGAVSSLWSQALVLVGVVLAFVCISVVNAYNITIAQKTKLYGIMRAMGGSRKQIAYLIFKETLFISVLAIPIGVLLGVGILYTQINTVGKLFNVSAGYEIVFDYSTIIIILALLVSLIAFLVIKGTVKQSKVTPIDAIRDAAGHAISHKGTRRFLFMKLDVNEVDELVNTVAYEKTTIKSKILSKLYGFEGSLANNNIARNRVRNQNNIITLLIAMVMMVVFFISLMNSLIRVQYLVKSELWNSTIINEVQPITDEVITEIEKLDNVTGVYKDYVSYLPTVVNIDKFGTGLNRAINFGRGMIHSDDDYLLTTKLRALDNSGLDKYKDKLIAGSLDEEVLNDNGVILVSKGVNAYININGSTFFEADPVLQLKVGDYIEVPLDYGVYSQDGFDVYVDGDRPNVKLKVVGIVKEDVFENSLDRSSSDTIQSDFKLITSEEMYKSLTGIEVSNKVLVNINTEGDRSETARAVREYCIKDGNYMTFNDSYYNLLMEKEKIAEDIFFQIVVATTILLMVFVNLVVTYTANVLERKREFAALTAIGMNRKQRLKVIFAEGTYIALTCTFIASAIGIVAVAGTLNNRTDFILSMNQGFLIVIGMILAVAIISVIICIIPARTLEKESIVDVLKEDM